MKKYILNRLINMIPMLIGITLISFFLMNLAPGEPTALLLDPKVRPEDLIRIKANLGLDKPVIIQYFIWLLNILKGNFGYSLVTTQPVFFAIGQRIPATLLLMGSSIIITLILAIPLGIWSALKKDRFFDKLVTVGSFLGMSLPAFWLSLIFILIFSLKLNLLPSFGMMSMSVKDAPIFIRAINIMWHMVIPLSVMTVTGLAGLIRYQRSAMLSIVGSLYIKSARARGINERTVIWKHALKNALLPLITILGLSLPALFGGAVVIEQLFAWPGMGMLGMSAIFSRDYPLIMGVILISSFLVLLGNLLADVLYAMVDPRITVGDHD